MEAKALTEELVQTLVRQRKEAWIDVTGRAGQVALERALAEKP
jgi:hypothetical protein